VGEGGDFAWAVNFGLTAPAGDQGGWIIQEVNIRREVQVFPGAVGIGDAVDTRHWFEAWPVPKNMQAAPAPTPWTLTALVPQPDPLYTALRGHLHNVPNTITANDLFFNVGIGSKGDEWTMLGYGCLGKMEIIGKLWYLDQAAVPLVNKLPRGFKYGASKGATTLPSTGPQGPDVTIANYFPIARFLYFARHELYVSWNDFGFPGSPAGDTHIDGRVPMA
jgi:hypothetical protein